MSIEELVKKYEKETGKKVSIKKYWELKKQLKK